ncbi:MAG: Zn-dependent hydrolase [Parcubacteria group bacterium Athens0714_26]|nr:MAG: Zn-dependent hydrolase [Parcubacteria group bacterium Athens1014_26]TSD03709.1 MAG: Zn-dependent hydrolase [Parcubacteria group bacterium Athens0714_26]
MVINWYGEGCFKIQTGGLTLLTDPFGGDIGLTPARGKFEAVLKTLTSWPLPEKEPDEQVILGAGEYDIQGVEIRGFGLPNESTDKFFKTIYLVNAEDLNLCFLGHLAEYPESDILDKIKQVDVLFMPAGGKPFISQELGAKFVKQFDPKIVVASFYKVAGLKRDADDAKDFVKELGIKEEIEEKLVLKKKDLSESRTRLILLKI